ncbi:MAG: InlB B-repeat-containing protein, partial [Kiritimatiellaeota bacterium]|nr:InlB B-repeat-containing protein [Kiritimatiellota bacterium]
DNFVYWTQKPGMPTEYYLLENRQSASPLYGVDWDADIPGDGLAIWHIDELGDRDNANYQYNASHANFEVQLMQADGLWDLNHGRNRGDEGDLYGAPLATEFSYGTTPSSRWWDGSNNPLKITDISASDETMTFIIRPGNDMFDEAFKMTGSVGSTRGDTRGATLEADEPVHGGAGMNSIWWTWAAPKPGMATVTVDGDGFDPALAVYRGDAIGILVPVASDVSPAGARRASVTFPMMSQTRYSIAVDGADNAAGPVTLTWDLQAAPLVTVNYNPVPGTVEPVSERHLAGYPYASLPTPVNPGYAFDGWYTQPGNGGDLVIANSPGSLVTSAVTTLYARWSPGIAVVTLDPQGGTVTPGSVSIPYGQTYGALPTPTRGDYLFLGWYTSLAQDGHRAQPTMPVAETRTATLYALWGVASDIPFLCSAGDGIPDAWSAIYRPAAPWRGQPVTPLPTVLTQVQWVASVPQRVVATANYVMTVEYDALRVYNKATLAAVSVTSPALSAPRGLAYDASSNRLAIANTVANQIVWMDVKETGSPVVGAATPVPGTWASPTAVNFTPDGDLLVADTATGRVCRVTISGEVKWSRFLSGKASPAPWGICYDVVDGKEGAWVADKANESVTFYSFDNAMSKRLNYGIDGKNGFTSPVDVQVWQVGEEGKRLCVTDAGERAVILFDRHYKPMLQPFRKVQQETFLNPTGTFPVRDARTFYLADAGFSKIHRLDLYCDADQDGMDDFWEDLHGLDSTRNDAFEDADGDGLINVGEFRTWWWDNYWNYRNGTEPLDWDTDGDGKGDYYEMLFLTNPLVADGSASLATFEGAFASPDQAESCDDVDVGVTLGQFTGDETVTVRLVGTDGTFLGVVTLAFDGTAWVGEFTVPGDYDGPVDAIVRSLGMEPPEVRVSPFLGVTFVPEPEGPFWDLPTSIVIKSIGIEGTTLSLRWDFAPAPGENTNYLFNVLSTETLDAIAWCTNLSVAVSDAQTSVSTNLTDVTEASLFIKIEATTEP